MKRWLAAAIAAFVLAPPINGQSQGTPPFRYERQFTVSGPGPYSLDVDMPLLSHCKPFTVTSRTARNGEWIPVASSGLGDLRFYDSDGREVPYLLIDPRVGEPEWVGGRILPVAQTKTSSGYEVDLGRAASIDRVHIEGVPAPFLKRVRLEGSGDRARWTVLNSEATVFDLPEEKLRRLDLDFDAGSIRYLRLIFDDRSSARLAQPSSVSARLAGSGTTPNGPRTPISFERIGSEPGRSRYAIRLPGPRLPITSIDLIVAGGNVLRDARVTESRLSGMQATPVQIGAATLRRAVRGDVAASEMRIPIQSPQEAVLELTVDDGGNPPLDITEMSATLALLPRIVFEDGGQASATRTLTARFGNARLTAPRYDLEAERGALASAQATEGRWGDLKEVAASGQTSGTTSVMQEAGAPVDAASFLYRRKISGVKAGACGLVLDAAVLAHSQRDFSDVRIVAADGRQVPYLVERLAEPLVIALPPLEKVADPRTKDHSTSVYAVHLPYPNLPSARLSVATSTRVFSRVVQLEVEPESSDDRRHMGSSMANWSHADSYTPAPPITLDILPVDATRLRLVVEEGDNAALPLEQPTLLLPGYRLRFVSQQAGDLELVYGHERMKAPRYDLALMAPTLLGVAVSDVALAAEKPAIQILQRTSFIFWAVLVLAVIVMLVLIARLVRQTPKDASQNR